MSDAALSKIAHLIKLEDDLVKVSSLKQQFLKEKTSVDGRLNTTTQTQISSIMSNISKLNESSTKLNLVKTNIGKIDQIFEELTSSSADYDIIRKMTDVSKFFTQVQHLYRDISKSKQYLEFINNLIDEEYENISQDISYPLTNILRIHYHLTQARNFSDYLEVLSETLSDDLRSIVSKITSPMKKTIKKFDSLLNEIIISVTEALKDGNTELVFKLIKILDFEYTEDLKCTLMSKLNLIDAKRLKSIDYSLFRGKRRNYIKFFYDKLEESLKETFDKCIEHFAEDKMLVYDNLNWMEDELVFVHETLAPQFPETWNIDNFIQDVYYNKLHNFTMDIIKTDPPAEDLLRILSYDSHYSKFMIALLSGSENDADGEKKAAKKEQKSIIGEELKKVVLEDYLKVIVIKMEEWNSNLMNEEKRIFVERDAPPDIYTYHQILEDEDAQDQPITLEIDGEVYVLPDFKTPLSMLKEQADVAVESGYGSILVGVIENWSRCYIERILNYKQIVEEEFDKYMSVYSNERFLIKESKAKRLFRRQAPQPDLDVENMSPEELSSISRPGLLEYLTALGNTYEINTDRLQDKFLPNYKNKVHTSFQSRIQLSFEDTVSPSTELNAMVIRCIIDIILNDLYPALSLAFTKSWYEEGKSQTSDELTMSQRIVETISEYMQEFRSYASYDIYLCTFALFLDSFISTYIRLGYENVIHGDGKKIDPKAVKKFKSFSESIGRDVTTFYGGLEHLFTRKDSAYLLNSLRAIEFLGDLGTCEEPMNVIPQIWSNEVLPSFYFCSVEYIRGICSCRKDMDKTQINTLVRECENIKKEYHESTPPPTTIIGTLNEFYYN